MTFIIQVRVVFLYYFVMFQDVGRTRSALFEPRNDLNNLAVPDFGGSKGLKTLSFYSVKYEHSEDFCL